MTEQQQVDQQLASIDEKDVDAILAKELNNMTILERETMFEEIHGVAPQVEETPDYIQKCLHEMDDALQAIREKPEAYHLAMKAGPQYVTSDKTRLMCLRFVNYDPQKAAEKLLAMLQGKLEMFGEEALVRSVYQSDLSGDDLHFLKSGGYQFLSSRDANGRACLITCHFLLEKQRQYRNPENLVRFQWYCLSLSIFWILTRHWLSAPAKEYCLPASVGS